MKNCFITLVIILQCAGCETYSYQPLTDQFDLSFPVCEPAPVCDPATVCPRTPSPMDLACKMDTRDLSDPANITLSTITRYSLPPCMDSLKDQSAEIKPFSGFDLANSCEVDYTVNMTPAQLSDSINNKYIKINLEYKSKYYQYNHLSSFGIYVDIINLGISTNLGVRILGTLGGHYITNMDNERDVVVIYKLPYIQSNEVLIGIYIDIVSKYQRSSDFLIPIQFHVESTKVTIKSVQIVDKI